MSPRRGKQDVHVHAPSARMRWIDPDTHALVDAPAGVPATIPDHIYEQYKDRNVLGPDLGVGALKGESEAAPVAHRPRRNRR